VEARKILDAGGFEDTLIVASNDLNEQLITSLKDQGAAIDVWGVGTQLVTSFDQPALGAIYKLAAIRRGGGEWQPKIKLSEQAVKVNTPGLCQVRRFRGARGFVADMIYDERHPPREPYILVDPMDSTRRRPIRAGSAYDDLLIPVMRNGEIVCRSPEPGEARQVAELQLAQLHPGIKRFLHPHQYPVGLEMELFETKTALILAAREAVARAAGREMG
jgi:nicotinate phosphoribosyltransferase